MIMVSRHGCAMFFRQKKSGTRAYLQIVENQWEHGGSRQRVVATLGRLDRLRESGQLEGRKFEFPLERAVFLTVLHRLLASGSDRAAEVWREDYDIPGTELLKLHHLYRAMAWLGEELSEEAQTAVAGQHQRRQGVDPHCRSPAQPFSDQLPVRGGRPRDDQQGNDPSAARRRPAGAVHPGSTDARRQGDCREGDRPSRPLQ